MLDFNKPLRTKSGLKVRKVLTTDYNGPSGRSVIVILEGSDGLDRIQTYNSDGTCFYEHLNLENIPEEIHIEKDVYLNVYKDNKGIIEIYSHATKVDADKAAAWATDRVACVHVALDFVVNKGECQDIELKNDRS